MTDVTTTTPTASGPADPDSHAVWLTEAGSKLLVIGTYCDELGSLAEIAHTLTCDEVNALAVIFALADRTEAATALIQAHIDSDEPGDLHSISDAAGYLQELLG